MEKESFGLNLRVYGLLIWNNKVLVTDENRGGVFMTKFPGGGLETPEGLTNCLKREFFEEIAIEINVKDFFYVNDFLQISRFNSSEQLISFYYLVETSQIDAIPISEKKKALKIEEQIFRWESISALNSDSFTFPIDRVVVERLKSHF